MDFYERMGVKRYINAHDTYTVYGGSRMAPNTLEAMREASGWFVELAELQAKLSERIAELTRNEGAFITNGAAGALALTASVCICRDKPESYINLPDTSGLKDEIIIFKCQRNSYDVAVKLTGARLVDVGDDNGASLDELRAAINENTAGVLYFASSMLLKGAPMLEDVLECAHSQGIPVVVDAAAQNPPADNLWHYTALGADMVIFSGGKTLRGPQASGMIVGKKHWLELCARLGFPAHGVCRPMKVAKEEMAGLYTAVENYVKFDHAANADRLAKMIDKFASRLAESGLFEVEKLPLGPVGQEYPRLGIKPLQGVDISELVAAMKRGDPGIMVGCDQGKPDTIAISPLMLEDGEDDIVIDRLIDCAKELRNV